MLQHKLSRINISVPLPGLKVWRSDPIKWLCLKPGPAWPSSLKGSPARPKNWSSQEDASSHINLHFV